MDRFDGQTIFVTGAARGQGRAHAVGFAEEGANVVAIDACAQIQGVGYRLAANSDLEETANLVRAADGRVVTHVADVRSQGDLDAAVALAMDQFGRIDHVVANAGIFTYAEPSWTLTEAEWSETIDINLNGVFRTCKAVVPAMLESGNGGSITITSTSNGYRGEPGHPAYSASKYGLVALMRSLAGELGPHNIRVNTIHPTCVKTPMMWNDMMIGLFRPGDSTATLTQDEWYGGLRELNMLPVDALEAVDITNVIKFLASNDGRYITASEVPVDAGYIMKIGI